MKSLFFALALCLSSLAFAAQDEGSPFTDVSFADSNILVEFEGTSYYLISLDQIPTADILAACAAEFAENCESMFAENFVETLSTLALPGTDWDQAGALDFVDLQLYFFQTHKVSFFEDAAVTAENLDQVILNRQSRE